MNARGSVLEGADLTDANLASASFQDANLRGATLAGARLSEADFSGADIRDAKHLLVDSTYVRNARFSPATEDLWSELRRNYTGAKMAFHVILLITFLVPLVMRVALWVSAERAQHASTQIAETLLKDPGLPPSPRYRCVGRMRRGS